MTAKEELAALRKRIEELEAKAKPPEPFKPQPYEPIDWTARMSMPPSALRAMVEAVPERLMPRHRQGPPRGTDWADWRNPEESTVQWGWRLRQRTRFWDRVGARNTAWSAAWRGTGRQAHGCAGSS
jgi:hypothetical protein